MLSDAAANIDLYHQVKTPQPLQMDLIEHTNSASSRMFYSSSRAETLFVTTLVNVFISGVTFMMIETMMNTTTGS